LAIPCPEESICLSPVSRKEKIAGNFEALILAERHNKNIKDNFSKKEKSVHNTNNFKEKNDCHFVYSLQIIILAHFYSCNTVLQLYFMLHFLTIVTELFKILTLFL
jgi:hypothetical protein